MVDLYAQHQRIQSEIQKAIYEVINSSAFINGNSVHNFSNNFAKYLNVGHVIGCGNGTDALQIALMALDLRPGDEVILPTFNYVAAAEVVALLNLKPVFADVDPLTFTISISDIKDKISERTKAVIAVHLFGQVCEMEDLLDICRANSLYLIEDAAQSIGAEYHFSDGKKLKAGTIGDIGTTSFFPSKNLGCMGDGGAIMTNNLDLAERIRMISNHGQKEKYTFELVGVNSRLDSIQAAILDVKLNYFESNLNARIKVADRYDEMLKECNIQVPYRMSNGIHSFNQYTIKLPRKRNALQGFLRENEVPTMVYYPSPLHKQPAYHRFQDNAQTLRVSEKLCKSVLSLPIHPELDEEQQSFICEKLLVGLEMIEA